MKRRGIKKVAVVLAAFGVFSAAALPQASAVELLGFEARIDVDTAGWGACGFVGDTLTGAPSYTMVLTATGLETTGAATGVILDVATASGNPATACTTGGFNSQYAAVQYTMEWTSVLGTTGTLVRTCVEALGVPICTPT